MILLSLDFETSGLDTANSRVREGGAILWSTGQHRILESAGFLVKEDLPVTAEETRIHHITQPAVDHFGFEPKESLDNILAMAVIADALVGQNILRFDYRVLTSWCIRTGLDPKFLSSKLIIDTLHDIPGVEGKKLQYMLADQGVLNPFPHGALTDAMSVLILIEKFTAPDGNIDPIVERARSPFVILQSHQPRGDASNKLARERKFRFNGDLKIWWRAVKALDVDAIQKEAPFDVSIRTDLSIDQLWSD